MAFSDSVKQLSLQNGRVPIMIVSIGLILLSVVYFSLCAFKPYMGAVLSMQNHIWIVESLDEHGLAFSKGMQIGDIPLSVNGQSADIFLKKYETNKSIRYIEKLTVINQSGQNLTADINMGSQSGKSLLELATWLTLSLIFWATGLYILMKRPENSAALLLLICATVLGLTLSTTLAADRLFPVALDIGIVAGTIGPWLLLHFIIILPEERAWLRSGKRLLAIYLFPLLILVMFPIIGLMGGQPSPEFRVFRLIGYGIAFCGVVGVAIYNYVRAKLSQTRQQMRIILIGLLAALVPFVILSIFPAAISGSIVTPSDFSVLMLSFIPLSLGYAVIAKHLMDIDIVIRRGVVYALITLTMAILLTVIFAIVLSSGVAPAFSDRFIIALLLSTLAVFLLGPIKNVIEKVVDKVIYKDRFDYRKTIQNLSTSLSATSEKEVASSLIVDAPVAALNLAGACLFIATDNGSLEVGASRGIFSSENSQRDLLGLVIRRNVGKEFPNLAETPNPEVAFIIPLVAADKELGLLFLSEKTSRQDFSGSDFYLIQGLASVSAVSLRGLLIAEQDIAQRRHHEQAIINAKQEWESTFDSIPDLICILDADHNIVRVNRAMADKLGLAPAQTIGRKCYELMHETHAPPEFCPGLKSSKGCSPGSEITRCGSVYQLNISKLNNTGKSSGRWVHIARDVTAVKNAEAEQQRLKEKAELSSRLAAVGEMAAGIAHEINNPLTGVLGYAELMLSEDLPDEVKEEVKIIADGSKRVAEIVKRMLTFARQTKPFKASVSVNEIIDNTLELRNYVLATANVEVVKNYQTDIPWIVADAGQLQQVFLNLIVNAEHAIKKTGHPGKLTISTLSTGDHVRITFADNGPGIERDVLPKLFQPFFTTKAPGEGTGLGLSLSRSIILEHGGNIDVESESGRGATFTIDIPIVSESEISIIQADETFDPQSVTTANLLVIDDELSIQQLLRQSLSAEGRTVDIAGNATEALEMIRVKHYDAILMDLRMPGISGMAFFEQVISRQPEIADRIIIITGDSLGIDVKSFVEEHRPEILAKPFDQATVKKAVDHILRANA